MFCMQTFFTSLVQFCKLEQKKLYMRMVGLQYIPNEATMEMPRLHGLNIKGELGVMLSCLLLHKIFPKEAIVSQRTQRRGGTFWQ